MRLEQVIQIDESSKCGLCLKKSVNWPVFSKQQFWEGESFASKINALIKCEGCSFLMCYTCYYDLSEPGKPRMNQKQQLSCYQRCGNPINLFTYLNSHKYGNITSDQSIGSDTNIQPQRFTFEPNSVNDILRRSFDESYTKLSNQQPFVVPAINGRQSLKCSIINKRVFNKYISNLSNIAVDVNLDSEMVNTQFVLPSFSGEQQISLQYRLQIENETNQHPNRSNVRKMVRKFIRGQIEFQLTEYLNKRRSTMSLQQTIDTLVYINKLQQKSNNITYECQDIVISPQPIKGTPTTNQLYEMSLPLLQLGVIDQVRDLLQYSLNERVLVESGVSDEQLAQITQNADYNSQEQLSDSLHSGLQHEIDELLGEVDNMCDDNQSDYVYRYIKDSQSDNSDSSDSFNDAQSDHSHASDSIYKSLEDSYKRQKIDTTQEPGYQLRNKCQIPEYSVNFKLYRELTDIQQNHLNGTAIQHDSINQSFALKRLADMIPTILIYIKY